MLKAFLRDFILKGIIFFIPIAFVIVFLTAERTLSIKSENLYHIDKGLIYKGISNVPFTGRVVDTLQGKILTYDVKNGLKNGLFKVSNKDGRISYLGQIRKNKNNGKWTYFYSNGNIESVGYFKNDKLQGEWKWYFNDGSLKSKGFYVNGKKEGKWIINGPYGNLQAIAYFHNNKQTYLISIQLPKSI